MGSRAMYSWLSLPIFPEYLGACSAEKTESCLKRIKTHRFDTFLNICLAAQSITHLQGSNAIHLKILVNFPSFVRKSGGRRGGGVRQALECV